MSTKFFTNNEGNTLIKKFEGIFTSSQNIAFFDALVGYFRASGYFSIRPLLEKVPKIRILVGINVDKLLADAQKMGLQFSKSDEHAKEDFLKKIKEDIENANYKKTTEDGIIQFIEDINSGKIQVKAHPNKTIHAKVYILRPEGFSQHTLATVITGSSNLTDAGLGSGHTYNYEFNVQLNDYQDVAFAVGEFEKLWAESVDILPVDIQNLKKSTYLSDDITPFQLYIKLLTEYFGTIIDYNPDIIGDLPNNFKKLSYQIDAVSEGFSMLLKHNGFILADVVGLGKTIIAAMVAKKFLIENGRENTRILVVYPPAVAQNWKNTFRDFKIAKYTDFISNGSLSQILQGAKGGKGYEDKEMYDLIIVDEAHKFRNHKTGSFKNLQLICKSPRANKGLIIGEQKKVILVSATPLNNKPDDIFSQIQLFQDARQSTLPVADLTGFFSKLIEEYKDLKRSDDLNINALRVLYGKIRKNIIEPITIRRTRTDLENIKAYQEDLTAQGIVFPEVKPPQKVEYIMDNHLQNLFTKTIFFLVGFSKEDNKKKEELKIAEKLGITENDVLCYSRYQAIAGLVDAKQNEFYENASLVSKSLAKIMKTQLVKRLESSFFAFKESLNNFLQATTNMVKMFAEGRIFIAPSLNINKLLLSSSLDEIEEAIQKISTNDPKNQTFKVEDFKDYFLEELKKDEALLTVLANDWKQINIDPKLDVFLEQLKKTFLNKKTNPEGKLVIFSESKDTIDYLHKKLANAGIKKVLSISSENRKKMYNTIVTNFDANWDIEKQVNNYNILLTTEVLAEGVNLHRSNVIIHYDTPWNSTKLMQRIGRVNRIGTKAEYIFNYVFYPSAQGDLQIKLNKTALMKIQAFHTAFGEDNQVYSVEEILDEVKLFSGDYKEAEDERLKFLEFLRAFKKANGEAFNKIKKMPLKSRTGRNAQEIKKPALKDGTIAFLKTEKKFEFYWVNKDNQSKEITPIEAFKIFEAKENEKIAPLIPAHHTHVNRAMEHFEVIEQKEIQNSTGALALGPIPLKAKKFLNGIMSQANEKQREGIQKIIILIDIGKYANLSSDIVKLDKKNLNAKAALLVLDKLIVTYSAQDAGIQKTTKTQVEIPTLIISESFG